MALVEVTPGGTDLIEANDINQIIKLLNGVAGFGQPVSLSALSDALNYVLTLKNAGAGSKALIVYAADGTTILLQVNGSGVKVSPDGTTSADVAGALVTETGAQTLSNKTLATPQINDSGGDHKYTLTPANLAANRALNLPLLTADDTLVVLALAQTLTNKTLTAPVVNTSLTGTAVGTGASQVAAGNHTHATSLTTANAALGADVTITPSNTYVDGPSVSLVAGTWLVVGTVLILPNSTQQEVTAKLWDGTTVLGSGQVTTEAADAIPIALHGIITLGSTTTVKISVAASSTGHLIKAAAPNNAAGNTASTLWAVKIA